MANIEFFLINCRYRTQPDWIKVIIIRKATDIAEVGLAEKNEPQRFEKAFEGVPKDVWHVFEDPKELDAVFQEALRKNGQGPGTIVTSDV